MPTWILVDSQRSKSAILLKDSSMKKLLYALTATSVSLWFGGCESAGLKSGSGGAIGSGGIPGSGGVPATGGQLSTGGTGAGGATAARGGATSDAGPRDLGSGAGGTQASGGSSGTGGGSTAIGQLTPQQAVALMAPGWNLGNSFDASPDETSWGNPTPTQTLINAVHSAGFKTLRLPVTWTNHIGAAPSYTIDSAWMAKVTQTAQWAIDAGMYVFVNTHHEADGNGGWVTFPQTSAAHERGGRGDGGVDPDRHGLQILR